MPRGKRKGGKREYRSNKGEDEVSDNTSVVSSISDNTSVCEESLAGDPEPEDPDPIEEFEKKLNDCIDGASQKNAKFRQNCLSGIQSALSKKLLYDFISDRKITLADLVERSLKKGKGEEQALAANLASLLLIQLGTSSESESILSYILPSLLSILTDKIAFPKARESCAASLSLCCFILSGEIEEFGKILEALEVVFSASYFKGNGAIPSHSPELSAVHCSALSGWSLLLSIAPTSHVHYLIKNHLPKLPELLESPDLELRITAGETIAQFYEQAGDLIQDFDFNDKGTLCATLKQLATDSNKHRAKKDRRQQRSSFRDILRTIEDGDYPDMKVKFGSEYLELDSWGRKRQYDAFCQVLGSGMNLHLQDNDLLRDIFGLGAPLAANGATILKISKFERHYNYRAGFKARTNARSKARDKRNVVIS